MASIADQSPAREPEDTESTESTLAVELLTNGLALPRWQADALALLQTQRIVRVASVVGIDERAGTPERLYCAMHEALEYRPHQGRGGESPTASIDARVAFPGAAVRRIGADRGERVEVDLVVN